MHEDEATPREKKISRNLAIGIHVGIVLLFIFGVSWHKRQSEPAAVADLWSSMSPPKQEIVKEPPLKIAPKIEKEPPLAPPPPPPKPEVKAAPKPDIALKEKQEKERKLKEQQELEHKKELDRKKDEEAKKLKAADARKKDDEKRKVAEQQELERKQEDEAKRAAAEKAAAAAKATAASRASYDKYVSLIQSRIKSFIVEPPNLQGNPQVEFDVVLIPGGEVLNARMSKSSGNSAYDTAVERAILKASPLPLPPDPALFSQFRELHLKIRPKE